MESRLKRVLHYPDKWDPRFFITAFLVALDIYALMYPGFNRRPRQWAAGISACVLTDLILLLFYKRVLLVPFSGFISSLGLLLLCDSRYVWPYALVGFLSICSKHFIRVGGRHIFNPLNFGIVIAALYFGEWMVVDMGRWGNILPLLSIVMTLGVTAAYRGRRLDLAATYLVVFAAGALVRGTILRLTPAVMLVPVFAPMMGCAFYLFTFYMITDPMTTPDTRRGRLVYAVMIAVLDNILRYHSVKYAPLYALFCMSGLLPIFRRLEAGERVAPVWRVKTVPV
ncbi:MAG: RnfABCDGE type electron transport complex subunit D [Elusimicrobia bacterium]|nr:RnfABCDGE type electron transport complex subunit D [Elusimicrobiota bacterium]